MNVQGTRAAIALGSLVVAGGAGALGMKASGVLDTGSTALDRERGYMALTGGAFGASLVAPLSGNFIQRGMQIRYILDGSEQISRVLKPGVMPRVGLLAYAAWTFGLAGVCLAGAATVARTGL